MDFKVSNQIVKDFLSENGYTWDEKVYICSGYNKVDLNEEFKNMSEIRLKASNWRGPVYIQYNLVDFSIIAIANNFAQKDLSNKWMEYVLEHLDNKKENAKEMYEWCNKCITIQKNNFESEKKKLMKQLEELEKENIDSCKELENTIAKCQNYIH